MFDYIMSFFFTKNLPTVGVVTKGLTKMVDDLDAVADAQDKEAERQRILKETAEFRKGAAERERTAAIRAAAKIAALFE
jgi:ABC-type Fe3+-hydroxamate transport system substrate-binding protein